MRRYTPKVLLSLLLHLRLTLPYYHVLAQRIMSNIISVKRGNFMWHADVM